MHLVHNIRLIACIAFLADMFFKTGIGSLAFVVWVMTYIYTHSLMEKKFFDDQAKKEKETQEE